MGPLVGLLCLLISTCLCADLIDEAEAPDATPPGCEGGIAQTALDSELGSVGFMKNIAEHPESLRAIAKRLLATAVESDAFKRAPACGDECASPPRARIVYKVEPTVFLPEAEQQALCLNLEDETTAKPLSFPRREFPSLAKLNDWIMEFSQGRGEDGKALYAQCGGNCSPRYSFYIEQADGTLSISADVLCGLARDKKSDQYLVSTAVHWQCASGN